MSISNLPVGNIFEKISPCNVLKSAILDLKRGGYKTSELTSLKKCDMKNYAEVELITISLEIFTLLVQYFRFIFFSTETSNEHFNFILII